MLRRSYLIALSFLGLTLVAFNASADELWTLRSTMPIPAMVLNVKVVDGKKVAEPTNPLNSAYSFNNGEEFVSLGQVAVAPYGVNNDISYQPIVLVYKLGADGQPDKTVTFGFPAQFLYSEQNVSAYEIPEKREAFDKQYHDLGKNFEVEAVNLQSYLNYRQRISRVAPEEPASASTQGTDSNGDDDLDFSRAITPISRPLPRPANSRTTSRSETSAHQPANQQPRISTNSPVVDSGSDINYRDIIKNPKFKDVIETSIVSDLSTVRVRTTDGKAVVDSDYEFKMGDRFIPVPALENGGRMVRVSDGYTLRRVYNVDIEGNILLKDGEPVEFAIPQDQMQYFDVQANDWKPVGDETNLDRDDSRGLVNSQSTPVPATSASPISAATETQTSAPVVATTPPLMVGPTTEVAPSINSATQKSPSTRTASVPVRPPAPQTDTLGRKRQLSECSNQEMAQKLSAYGESCQLVEINDFKLVKSQLIQDLKGERESTSLLMRSGVIAMNKTTSTCNRVDVTHEAYSHNRSSHTAVNNYKTGMASGYERILSLFHRREAGRIGAAFNDAPQNSNFSYACERDQKHCRYAFSQFNPIRLPIVQEMSMFAENPVYQEKVRLYGPSPDGEYLLVYKKGNQDSRAIVLRNQGNGNIEDIISQMKIFEGTYKYKTIADIDRGHGANILREIDMGHFIRIQEDETDQNARRARLGTPDGLSLIGKIRRENRFYQLQCLQNVLTRSSSLPSWNGSDGAAGAE